VAYFYSLPIKTVKHSNPLLVIIEDNTLSLLLSLSLSIS
jgi:hypothetical protein